MTKSEKMAVTQEDTMPKKKPDGPEPVDVRVGARVRMRRLQKELSQEKLGDTLGITFQQIQKYEKGMNRISASRLQQIAHALDVPVSFFFDADGKHAPADDVVLHFATDTNGIALMKVWPRLTPSMRRALVEVAASMESRR